MMRQVRNLVGVLSFLLAMAVIVDPANASMFATCCLIAAALALLEIANALDSHKYQAITMNLALVGIYATGILTVGH